MAPLGLPPGPYLEALMSNGLFSATDAFNFHFYGYAEDFSGTYRQFENAVSDRREIRNGKGDLTGASKRDRGDLGSMAKGARSEGFDSRLKTRAGRGEERRSNGGTPNGGVLKTRNEELRTSNSRERELPVMLTEYGYGSLSDAVRGTAAGRVAQWRWFRSVGEQARELRVEGLMAFCLEPYLERGAVEFGLVTPPVENRGGTAATDVSSDVFRAGGLSYRREDFSDEGSATKGKASGVPSWMRSIGHAVGPDEATPALAWLLDQGRRKPYTPRDWKVNTPQLSPVVIDFVARDGLVQLKRYTGYLALGGKTPDSNEGAGDVVLYNFSTAKIRGRLKTSCATGLRVDGMGPDEMLELMPGERRVLPLHVMLSPDHFERLRWALRFEPEAPESAAAVFTTAFYPEASGMTETVVTHFTEGVPESEQNRRRLADRPLAREEVGFHDEGRWRVTPGLSVAETPDGLWRFSIASFPGGQPRPAAAELPLRDGAVFPADAMMRFAFRLAEPAGATPANGRYCEAYFRTANGNLYQVWPRQYATGEWSEYTEVKENYTMAFYSRANLPWRFADNRPIALVLWFRPVTAPAVYEVKDARIVEIGRGSRKN